MKTRLNPETNKPESYPKYLIKCLYNAGTIPIFVA
jgi:hypothetical protein